MLRRLVIALVIAGTSLGFAGSAPVARAQGTAASPAGTAGSSGDELTALESSLTREHAALSTSDCATACRALASIRRAADKICALDPDERCSAARAKADDATRRVREACPECAIASAPPQPAPPMAKPASKGGPDTGEERVAVQTSDNAPPSESRRGGCAGCTSSGTSRGDLGTLGLALAALAWVTRRRAQRRPRD